ncbi:MAG: DUF6603 domain-containing protein [Anaerolineae bacterium]
MASTTDRASEQLAQIVRALGKAGGDVEMAGQLLALLGWDLPPGVNDIGLSQLDVSAVAVQLDALIELRSQPDTSDVALAAATAEVVAALANALDHLRDISASFQATPAYLQATDIVDQFFPRLADLLVIQAVGTTAAIAVPLGVLLGVFELTLMPADSTIFQVEHVRQAVRWDRLSALVTNPTDVMRDVYGWGTAGFDGNALVANIGRVVEHFAAEVRLRDLPRAVEEQLAGRPVPEADAAPAAQLFVSLDKGLGFGAYDVGLSLYPLRPAAPGGTDGGLGLSPYAFGTTDTSFPLSDALALALSASADLQGGLALMLRPGQDPRLLTGLLGTGAGGGSDATFALALRHAALGDERVALFSAPGLTIDAAAVSLGVGVAGGDINPALTGSIEDGRIRVAPDASDGFLASILPPDGITTTLDLVVSWSQRDGLRIHGGAGLHTTLALHQQAGPLRVETLDLALAAASDALTAAVTVSGAALLGPVTASVAGVGVAVALRFTPGNLGSADLGAEFKPPTGVGLAIDAAGVAGGGFLFYDSGTGQYAGVVELTLEGGIAVKGVGLIATHLPGGAAGFSLLVIITAQDFEPIPLGLGFKLTGIGGLLAVNRTFSEDVLRAGLKNHTLDSILFPRDPIRNAAQILSALNTAFPPARGHHLLGPIVQLAWGTPTLLTANLGVFLEFGARLRLLILGQVVALLPRPDNALIRLQMDTVGVLDFDQGTAALDATLYDSRLLEKFVLTGDMAMRLKWAGSPSFALAVGGLHPAFNPPPNFPKLARIALSLTTGDNPRLRCEAYFAVTSNTVQFGARAELYAEAAGFSIQGEIGFDVLIQMEPFQFLADFVAQVQLKRGSTNLFKVRVEGSLAGPRPLHLKGKATFEVLWWDVSIRVDRTLVEGEQPPPAAAVDVLAQVRDALGQPGNWVSQLPDGQRAMVTLRPRPGAPTDVLLHPLGKLIVKQNIAPLDLDIARFGAASPAGARRFTISRVAIGGQSPSSQPVTDFFAPAQFLDMSDDEKLSRPSFEAMAAGVSIGSDGFAFPDDANDWLEVEAIEFETIIVDKAATQSRPGDGARPYRLTAALLGKQALFGAAGGSELRRTGRAKYRTARAAPVVVKEGWSIVSTVDLAVQPAAGGDGRASLPYSEAAEALAALEQQSPTQAATFKIVRLSELT